MQVLRHTASCCDAVLATLTTQAVLMLKSGVSNTPHGTKLINLRYKLSIKIVIFGGAQVLRHTASCYDAVLATLTLLVMNSTFDEDTNP